jgi:U2-associated protein SR140
LRKSKKDLEREAEERKAKEEAEASAKALEEFTAAFEGDGVEYQPLGGMMGGFARRGRGGGGFVRAGG